LARLKDHVTVQTVNIENRRDFVEEEISMPERELIKMAEIIWRLNNVKCNTISFPSILYTRMIFILGSLYCCFGLVVCKWKK